MLFLTREQVVLPKDVTDSMSVHFFAIFSDF